VRWVVENISLLLHAAIFLFFAGLLEFLFAINDEVARVILVVVCVFAAGYVLFTSLPLLSWECPFQTPLTSFFWYAGHGLAIICMAPFSCSKGIRKNISELWKGRILVGFDFNLIDFVARTSGQEKNALESTLKMCGEDSEVEAFVEAIPYYLQIDHDADKRIGHRAVDRIHAIVSLLTPKGSELPLGDRIVHLFVSCVKDHKKMDDMLRRRRAIACSHAIGEISKALLLVPGLNVVLPKSLRILLRRLRQDHDPKIVFAALNASTVFEHALSEQEQLARAESKKVAAFNASYEKLVMLSLTAVNEKSPLSLHHPTGDDSADRRLLALTEFMSSMLELIPRLDKPSHGDLEDTNMIIQKLGDGLNGRDYSPTAQQRFVKVLSHIWHAHLAAGSTGMCCQCA
jgi:hypothetical protein